jgi:hypothetical protein
MSMQFYAAGIRQTAPLWPHIIPFISTIPPGILFRLCTFADHPLTGACGIHPKLTGNL